MRRTDSRSRTTGPSAARRRRSASLTTSLGSDRPGGPRCSSTSARYANCGPRPLSRSRKSTDSVPGWPARSRRLCRDGRMEASRQIGGSQVDHYGGAPEIVIITGMSGAGRSTAAKSLEDLDWFVADNLPPAMLPTMLDLADRASLAGIAAIVDVRSRAFSTDLKSAISSLGARGVAPQVLFLEASDPVLVQ